MKAIEISKFGGPDVLRLCQRPDPAPGPGEVLIKVVAAGINRPDVIQREGRYPPPPGASDIPGLEISGTIAALGAAVKGWAIGDRVCALVTGGGYAEYCAAPVETLLPAPKSLPLAHAAGLPETVFTVWSNVFERGGLDHGEWLLVHGGSSGIGSTAIQLAKAFDAHVITTAGSDEKCRFCRDLGADAAINYHDEDFVAATLAITHKRGVDVVLDMVGGDYLPRNLQCLAENGRHVTIAFLKGPETTLSLAPIMLKRLTLTGSTLRARPLAFKAALAQSVEELVWPLIEAGRFRPMIDSIFPLEEAALAHRLMDSSLHKGKILLQISDE
ncbi:NAD(P)H quinone oxidoreductase [Iodidimonas nitroreducens]|uniref:NAD(P)H quinone oxidoreductase n=1 Tax=Iodidimonas nitroreducens TaxID=1236968 RepID=A0A5A7N9F0_9PROT|nr:NAD(P)H-quinone oxidoreductase [Iodidimonas nitroreducens]GAK33467.1 quinone oxidoreductase PIG3 [alpha proteobacterium Q-1]GER04404.1 NAD(P)H quinone oxidoreductase [Iodidimonas nitroreducens]